MEPSNRSVPQSHNSPRQMQYTAQDHIGPEGLQSYTTGATLVTTQQSSSLSCSVHTKRLAPQSAAAAAVAGLNRAVGEFPLLRLLDTLVSPAAALCVSAAPGGPAPAAGWGAAVCCRTEPAARLLTETSCMNRCGEGSADSPNVAVLRKRHATAHCLSCTN